MNTIKVKCPAKVNLTLEILNRREDGFHNIKSIMQTIDLYDYLTISIDDKAAGINLSGTCDLIPYDEKNLVYKAVDLYLREANLKNVYVSIHIEKNIPIAAGLAGGSTDAAGALWGLNYLFKIFNYDELNNLCAQLGSDLNVCLNGGTLLATSRGEVIEKIVDVNSKLSLIKPINLGISAAEAYRKYASKTYKPQNDYTGKMLEAINRGDSIEQYLYNDLEYAIFDDYKELQEIKNAYPKSIMSGSGSTYFLLRDIKNNLLDDRFLIIDNLNFISTGVSLA